MSPASESVNPGFKASARRSVLHAAVRLGTHVATLAVGLATVGVIVKAIGVGRFGVVGVVNALVAYGSVATVALTATVGREVAFALESGDVGRASRDLSTAIVGTLLLFGIVAPLPTALAISHLDGFIAIPAGEVGPARLLFGLSVLGLVITTLSGPLGVAMFVRNRQDLAGAMSLTRAVIYLALVTGLFATPVKGFTAIGLAGIASSSLVLWLTWIIHRRILREVAVAPAYFDWDSLRRTLSLGGWLTLSQVGALLVLQSDVVVANLAMGPVAAGQLAALTTISLQVRALAGVVAGLFAPVQTQLAARGAADQFGEYLLHSIRIVSIIVGLIVGVFSGAARDVLTHWLGSEFAPLAPLSILMMLPLIPILGSTPAWNAMLALGKIKVPALLTLAMGLVTFGLSLVLAGPAKLGLPGVVVAGIALLAVRNMVFVPWYVRRMSALSPGRLIWATAEGVGVGTVAIGATLGARWAIPMAGTRLALVATVCLGAGVTAAVSMPRLKVLFREMAQLGERRAGPA